MSTQHKYDMRLQWTGNTGAGTSGYANFERSYTISAEGKPLIEGSSDPAFRGDDKKYNPEELFLASISSCHMLWFLHLCATAGIVVLAYTDNASGTMIEEASGSGHFTEVVLNPVVSILDKTEAEKANALHKKANEYCFIANSLNFKVVHRPVIKIDG